MFFSTEAPPASTAAINHPFQTRSPDDNLTFLFDFKKPSVHVSLAAPDTRCQARPKRKKPARRMKYDRFGKGALSEMERCTFFRLSHFHKNDVKREYNRILCSSTTKHGGWLPFTASDASERLIAAHNRSEPMFSTRVVQLKRITLLLNPPQREFYYSHHQRPFITRLFLLSQRLPQYAFSVG